MKYLTFITTALLDTSPADKSDTPIDQGETVGAPQLLEKTPSILEPSDTATPSCGLTRTTNYQRAPPPEPGSHPPLQGLSKFKVPQRPCSYSFRHYFPKTFAWVSSRSFTHILRYRVVCFAPIVCFSPTASACLFVGLTSALSRSLPQRNPTASRCASVELAVYLTLRFFFNLVWEESRMKVRTLSVAWMFVRAPSHSI